ncbi:MAG TPA: hypothetical protein VF440_00425, partial [Novosphingobium sp.]
AILIKSLRDAQMASISAKAALGKATSLPCGRLRPICSPFGRLDGAGYEFTAYSRMTLPGIVIGTLRQAGRRARAQLRVSQKILSYSGRFGHPPPVLFIVGFRFSRARLRAFAASRESDLTRSREDTKGRRRLADAR